MNAIKGAIHILCGVCVMLPVIAKAETVKTQIQDYCLSTLNADKTFDVNKDILAEESAKILVGKLERQETSTENLAHESSDVLFYVSQAIISKEIDVQVNELKKMLSMSALKGDVRSLFWLGKIVHDVDKSVADGLDLMECAAQNGSVSARAELAEITLFRENKYSQKALEYLINAANNGVPISMLQLGILYSYGRYVEEDKAKAASFYTKAAVNGLPLAALNLGILLNKGWLGQPADKREAAKWYLKGAELGDFRGYSYAGSALVENGDIEDGIKMLELAVSKGQKDAVDYLKYARELLKSNQLTDGKKQ